MPPRRFEFRFAPSYQRAARVFGVTPERTWVEVGEERLEVRYGPWHVSTPIANIARVQITGPYRYIKTAGPARLGITDLGLTFASNGDRGVEITFHQKIAGVEPLGLLRHPELTVTVAEADALAELLAQRTGGER
jgi:hypothetical protein